MIRPYSRCAPCVCVCVCVCVCACVCARATMRSPRRVLLVSARLVRATCGPGPVRDGAAAMGCWWGVAVECKRP